MENTSSWLSDVEIVSKFPKLKKDIKTEVLIIGGGLSGILSAYLLSSSDKQVTVVEKDKIGNGVTAYTTAFITQVIDTTLSDLKEMFGKEQAKLIWQSHEQAINLFEEVVSKEKIDCEFQRCPAYIYAQKKTDRGNLIKEERLARSLGFTASFEGEGLGFNNKGFLKIEKQAKFHPLKFLTKLAETVSDKAALYEETEVSEISGEGPFIASTASGKITADYVLISTHDPVRNPIDLKVRKAFYSSYVIEAQIPQNSLEEAVYWDLESPYHYFRIDSKQGYQRMILGGEDHRSELKIDPEKNYKALENYLQKLFPEIEYKITRKWKGPIIETVDGLALIGRFKKERQLLATGFSGNGMTYSAIAAMIFKDLVLGKTNPWAKIYDPERIPSPTQLLKKGFDYSEVFVKGVKKAL